MQPARAPRPERSSAALSRCADNPDAVRERADLFGGEDRIPLAVKTAMRLKDYDHGKPLTARRIDAVRQAVERHFAAYPAAFEQAKTLAARVCSQFDAAAVNAAIAQALSPVITDPDATQIVVRYIDRILVTDNQQLRPVEEIRRHVQDLLVNVQELRSAGKDNRLAFDVGFALLDRLCGRTLPNGLFTLLFAGMNTYSLKVCKSVKPGCGAGQIHLSLSLFAKAPQTILPRSELREVVKESADRMAFLAFVEKMMLSRLSRRELQNLHDALLGEDGQKLLQFYQDFANGQCASGFAGAGHRERQAMQRLASEYAVQAQELGNIVASALGLGPEEYQGLPAPDGTAAPSDAAIAAICSDLLDTVQTQVE